MQDFLKNNKKFIAIVSVILIAIILFLVFSFKNNDENQTQEQQVTKVNKVSVIKEYTGDSVYLQDFFRGTNGWHTDILDKYNDNDYTVIYEKNNDISYVSYFKLGEEKEYQTFPNYTTSITLLKNKGNITTNSADKVVEIDDTSRLIIFKDSYLGDKFVNDNFEVYSDGTSTTYKTEIQNDLDIGYGIEISLIKECIDLTAFERESHINFNDEIWKTVNYKSRYKCMKIKDVEFSNENQSTLYNKVFKGKDFCYLTYTTETSDKTANGYISYWKVNNSSENLLSQALENFGYQSIEQVLQQGYYVSSEEITNNKLTD